MGLKTSFTRLYHFSYTMIYFSVVFCLIVASMLQVRIAACKSMAALAKFSTQYAQKALDMLMDMMNDDTEAVILQTLQTLFRMATYGCLNVQEQHMHMVLRICFAQCNLYI
jgi:5,10-methenyltetrahydromethanopterin hydrogenase